MPHAACRMPHWSLGFTLMELLVTVSIIGILASIAVPSYRKTVERSYWRAAQDILQTIYAGESVYRSANGTFVQPAGNWGAIYMDNPNVGSGMPVTFSVPSFTASTFLAVAARGDNRCMSIDETRNLNTATAPSGCANPWPLPP